MSVCVVRFCACPHARACVGQGRARPRRWAGGGAERVSAGRRVRRLELSWTARASRRLRIVCWCVYIIDETNINEKTKYIFFQCKIY